MRLTRVCRYQRSCALSCEFLGMESRKFLGVMSSGFLDACGTQFCKELGIARQTFTNIKNRVAQNGRSRILSDSTAPKNPARQFNDTVKIYRLFDHAHTHVTIYQIIDDASRFDVGTKAFASPENGTDARCISRGVRHLPPWTPLHHRVVARQQRRTCYCWVCSYNPRKSWTLPSHSDAVLRRVPPNGASQRSTRIPLNIVRCTTSVDATNYC